MIKYSLKCVEENCNKNEPFDGWFQNSASFEKQIDAGYISCPYCGSLNIKKNLMSPSVKSTKEKIPKIISKNVKHNELNKNFTIDYRETAPEASFENMFVVDGEIDRDLALESYLSSCLLYTSDAADE